VEIAVVMVVLVFPHLLTVHPQLGLVAEVAVLELT
jgi:hypothetical protein